MSYLTDTIWVERKMVRRIWNKLVEQCILRECIVVTQDKTSRTVIPQVRDLQPFFADYILFLADAKMHTNTT